MKLFLSNIFSAIAGFVKAHTVVSIITAVAVVTVGVATPIIVSVTKDNDTNHEPSSSISASADDNSSESESGTDTTSTDGSDTSTSELDGSSDTSDTNSNGESKPSSTAGSSKPTESSKPSSNTSSNGTNSNTSSTNKPTTSTPSTSTPSTTEDDAETAKKNLIKKLNSASSLSQYLVVHYQNTSTITPDQIIPFLITEINLQEGLWDTIPAETLYKYARKVFVMDDKMINDLKASEYYNPSDNSYDMVGEFYSNSVHNTYVNAYEDLGNNEYIIYVKYGAWDSSPETAGFYNISQWKAKVKLQDTDDEFDYSRMFYYSFEKIDKVPSNATLTNYDAGY